MGCGNCGSKKDGAPSGCKSHGSCASGGCNRLNVHNWLADIPIADFSKPYPFIEISFNNGSRKDFYKSDSPFEYSKGDFITVEGTNGGFDVGTVSVTGELVKLQMKKRHIKENDKDIKRVLRHSNAQEIEQMEAAKKREKEVMLKARVIIRHFKIEMKLSEVEIQADGKKATYFYTADDRIDFRELIKEFSNEFKMRVEMKQIGIRQEAQKVGGIGSCGRELCCSTWLNDFKSVSTAAARYQNLSINQTKLSGQCGRLKCCLNYELDTYMDALKVFPNNADKIQTQQGIAFLQKKDIFKKLMWYSYAKSNKLYPLSIPKVLEIIEQNKKGEKPFELIGEEIEKKENGEKELEFVDTVGHFTLKSLEKKKKPTNKKKNTPNAPNAANTNAPKPAQKPKPENATPNSSTPKPNNTKKKYKGPRKKPGE